MACTILGFSISNSSQYFTCYGQREDAYFPQEKDMLFKFPGLRKWFNLIAKRRTADDLIDPQGASVTHVSLMRFFTG